PERQGIQRRYRRVLQYPDRQGCLLRMGRLPSSAEHEVHHPSRGVRRGRPAHGESEHAQGGGSSMKMNSARQLWHDAYYQRRESTTSYALEVGMLQASIQKTEKDRRTDVALDQALCGMVQLVIGTLPASLQCFGHWMYSPLADDDHREIAEELVFAMAAAKLPRMTEAKREKAQYVAKGVLYRYRRQHQGGQSSTPDPLPTPECFRAW